MRLSFKPSGTSPFTMRCANPSATAVLPTPGSPIKTGLFLLRLSRICMMRRISSSRPITGSSLPSLARRVKSVPNFSSDSKFCSAVCESTRLPPRCCSMAAFRALTSGNSLPECCSRIAKKSTSRPTKESPNSLANFSARSTPFAASLERYCPGCVLPETLGSFASVASSAIRAFCASPPAKLTARAAGLP